MFRDTKAFSGFSVDDLAQAKEFYTQILGLEVEDMDGLLRLKIAGGTDIIVYPKPNHTPATFTILNFPVNNIDTAVADLAQHGVQFEHYDNTDEKGISRGRGPNVAWFKDPAGNILSVLESN